MTVPSPLRHHTNPVGTEWRWKMDQPEVILQEALENHLNMIRQFKGNSSSVPTPMLSEKNQQWHLQSTGENVLLLWEGGLGFRRSGGWGSRNCSGTLNVC